MKEIPNYRIRYYVTAQGRCPFAEFMENEGVKIRVKFAKLLAVLSQEGPNLKRPYADILRNGIRELRMIFSSNQYRALYFFFHGDEIIISHVFIKKTKEVPNEEIERALHCKRDFEKREGGKI